MTADWPVAMLTVALALYGSAAAIALIVPRRMLAVIYPLCLLAALLGCANDLSVLTGQPEFRLRLPIGLPLAGLRLHLDALSAFFGLIVNLGIAAASLYGLGLDRKDLSKRIEPYYPVFCAGMNLVLLADDAFGFLFFWELMSLSSWALVVARHEEEECRKAAYVYLIMAAAGTAALLFAFGGMAGPAGGYAFDDIRAHKLSPVISALVLFAALFGAGSKAGLMPLHAWLPQRRAISPR
jgi:formate hydrogenlyase subunit 3/multisubunit Na+/H+ antiporter MnhD subunit